MSMPRHHAEWLSLIEVSGPFLSLPVLLRAFPQGLEPHDPEHLKVLRLAYEQWEDNQQGGRPDPAIHRAWVQFVLSQTLGLPEDVLAEGQAIAESIKATVSEHGETLRPHTVVVNPPGDSDAGKARLLIHVYPRTQGLDKIVPGSRWMASPSARMTELLHGAGVRLGLVTNGEQWMLVDAPAGETTGYASWFAALWLEEHITLRSFRTLLSAYRFFGVAEKDTLEALLAESATDQQEVTDQLGYQVRRAVEVLVQAVDRVDRDRGRHLLAGISEKTLYEAALTVMMRLVFLFCAEERGLLHLGDDLYDQHYAVSTMRAQLREAADQAGEEVLERRHDAWSRILATCRAVHGGIKHEALRMPAYGGALFDPDRFPFLEGRVAGDEFHSARPLPVDNRTVLHLLEALQVLRVRLPGGGPAEPRLLSFRALDVEQIGHVYEGLLDHTARRATEPVVGLAGTRDKEPEIPLSALEMLNTKWDSDLLPFLKDQTGRSPNALKAALQPQLGLEEQRLLTIACGNDSALYSRLLPFAGLLRSDSNGYPVVIPAGSVYVTQGTDRRSTGTHYTPRSLTEPIVQRALEPLVYQDVAEGVEPSPETLRTAKEILALRVCDMATGSGAFLVQACRYLAERLGEAWKEAEKAHPGEILVTPEGDFSLGEATERLIPADADERLIIARRLVADRCLYGVDKNPMAVEMAKLSLWLVTMQKDRAFTFLDHAIKCGDSLVGVTKDQLRTWSLDGKGSGAPILELIAQKGIKEAIGLRRRLLQLASNDVAEVQEKERLHRSAEQAMANVKLAADLVVAPSFGFTKAKDQVAERKRLQALYTALPTEENARQLRARADELLAGQRTFHWCLEFPEVFFDLVGDDGGIALEASERDGFDVIVGNPPFMGGQKITGVLGVPYREYLVNTLGHGKKGSADYVAYFYLQAFNLLRTTRTFGLIATNTIAQGDTREVGLEQIISCAGSIYAAVRSQKWPGAANLEVAVVHLHKGDWQSSRILDGASVGMITAFLDDGTASGKPVRLIANQDRSFQGSIVLGMGFVLEPEQAQRLTRLDSKYADVLFPYLNGEDLNSRPDQSASRWVISFSDWPLGRVAQALPHSGKSVLSAIRESNRTISDEWLPKAGSRWLSAGEERQRKWLQLGVVPDDYPGPVAADYVDCLRIVERLVKPERDKLANGDATARDRSRRWWRYGRRSDALYSAVAGRQSVLAITRVTHHVVFGSVPARQVFADRLFIFPLGLGAEFAILQSWIHECWARQYSGTFETRLNYSPTDCFETFPLPALDTDREHTLVQLATGYYEHRRNITRQRGIGFTKAYNLFHDPSFRDDDIEEFRKFHVEMDYGVRDAYAWHDLDLGHGFYGEGKEARFTFSPEAKHEVLRRLLKLNHERAALEEQQAATQAADIRRTSPRKRGAKAPPVEHPVLDVLAEQATELPTIGASIPDKVSSHIREEDIEPAILTWLVAREADMSLIEGMRSRPIERRPLSPAVRRLHSVRLAKEEYAVQEMAGVPLTRQFERKTWGPLSTSFRAAVKRAEERKWLVVERFSEDSKATSYSLGPEALSAIEIAFEVIGDRDQAVEEVLFYMEGDATIEAERQATVHKAWADLVAVGKPADREAVVAEVQQWKPNRAGFSMGEIRVAYEDLRNRGLLRPQKESR